MLHKNWKWDRARIPTSLFPVTLGNLNAVEMDHILLYLAGLLSMDWHLRSAVLVLLTRNTGGILGYVMRTGGSKDPNTEVPISKNPDPLNLLKF